MHWHAFIQFTSNRPRPKTKNAHWEIPESVIGAINYCKEKGEPSFEKGEAKLNNKNTKDWATFIETCKMTPKEQMLDGPFSKFLARYGKFADDIFN